MKHETQVETLHTLLQLRKDDRDQEMLGRVVSTPVSNYTDPAILERELATVFRDNPIVAGHASQVREPGACLLGAWDKLPYVVVRDKEGVLRAFLNICQHRGARLVSGAEKTIKMFVCPFHGWSYELDGTLRTVTKAYDFPGLDCSKHNLKELSVVEHNGLVWIHPTPGAKIDLAAYLGPQICSDLEHLKLDEMSLHRTHSVVKNANWKILLQTYLERYHVPILHAKTIAEVFRKGVIAHHQHEPHIRIAAARTNLEDAMNVDPAAWRILDYASVFYTLFPNTFLITHANIVSLNSFFPIAPDKTLWTHEMLYRDADYPGEDGQASLAQRFANIDAVFEHEDFGIVEGVQKGLPYGDPFHTLGLEEGLLAMFQDSIDRRIAAANKE
jgi:phenylpropionate dioxygenase-like ring-hydroxylating dioxygenase large terminal subunit